jgi:hypothetical protein
VLLAKGCVSFQSVKDIVEFCRFDSLIDQNEDACIEAKPKNPYDLISAGVVSLPIARPARFETVGQKIVNGCAGEASV